MSAITLKQEPISSRYQCKKPAHIPKPRLTAEEYLAQERQAEHKSEYFDGEIVAMAGASREHNLIVGSLIRLLGNHLLERDCNVYPSDMRLHIPNTNTYTYPDVVVTCGEEFFTDDHFDVLKNPLVLIEVLSDSTEAYDRGKKFRHSQQIPSLAEYLLVSQVPYRVELYVRQSKNLWLYSVAYDPDDVIHLASIDCKLSLKDIYVKVQKKEEGE